MADCFTYEWQFPGALKSYFGQAPSFCLGINIQVSASDELTNDLHPEAAFLSFCPSSVLWLALLPGLTHILLAEHYICPVSLPKHL